MTQATNWPSREQWAEQRRSRYIDLDEVRPSSRASDYVSGEEIEQLIASLRELWKAEGVKMREAKRKAGSLVCGAKENRHEYFRRWEAMNKEEQELVSPVDEAEALRRMINKVIKGLREDRIDYYAEHCVQEASGILAGILAREKAAFEAAYEARVAEIEATPIDDAAWEEELRRREREEREAADPSRFVIRVG